MAPTILVVDDEASIREMLEIYLQREGYGVFCAADGVEALELFRRETFDIVIADIKMPGMDGITLLHRVRELSPATIFIMITAYASFETAQESMQQDAYDYIAKPFDVEDIRAKIDSALARRAQQQVPDGAPGACLPGELGYRMIGRSRAMHKVFDLIQRAATSKSNVLITGESGTGKELVARAIHYYSERVDDPFVVINCGGIPETLLESELFGYKKGAFTGAARDKKGFLAAADGGTLFLDEVGELPLALQVKLLRVVQEKTFTPVGGVEETRADVRIISATNRNLETQVQEGSFRNDLYYRLNVINIAIPPLRDRPEDIPELAEFFLKKYAREMKKDVSEISSYALDCLRQYPFPGNVRELENIIERGLALAKTSIMLPESIELSRVAPQAPGIQPDGDALPPEGMRLEETLLEVEKRYVREALHRSGGSITGAARLLGVTFRSMRYRLAKLGVNEKDYKS